MKEVTIHTEDSRPEISILISCVKDTDIKHEFIKAYSEGDWCVFFRDLVGPWLNDVTREEAKSCAYMLYSGISTRVFITRFKTQNTSEVNILNMLGYFRNLLDTSRLTDLRHHLDAYREALGSTMGRLVGYGGTIKVVLGSYEANITYKAYKEGRISRLVSKQKALHKAVALDHGLADVLVEPLCTYTYK